jgi:hypothetical protein
MTRPLEEEKIEEDPLTIHTDIGATSDLNGYLSFSGPKIGPMIYTFKEWGTVRRRSHSKEGHNERQPRYP